jgi:hypothetical protein
LDARSPGPPVLRSGSLRPHCFHALELRPHPPRHALPPPGPRSPPPASSAAPSRLPARASRGAACAGARGCLAGLRLSRTRLGPPLPAPAHLLLPLAPTAAWPPELRPRPSAWPAPAASCAVWLEERKGKWN